MTAPYHDYERTRPIKNEEPVNKGGVIYVTLGGGGSQLYIQTYQEDWMYKFAAVYHFAHFKINRRTLTLNVYNIKNSLVDTLTLTK